MEGFQTSVNTLEEVRKLQELVRRLEFQNLQLRNKHNTIKSNSIYSSEEMDYPRDSKTSIPDAGTNTEYLDSLEIIRLSDLDMSDDESWLYSSPKQSKDGSSENSYSWLRKDVDNPRNEKLQIIKKNLSIKLNEMQAEMTSNHKILQNEDDLNSLSHLKSSFSAMYCGSNFNSRTFTKSKTKQAMQLLEKLDFCDNGNIHNPLVSLHKEENEISSESVADYFFEDANELQEIARIQEERLKRDAVYGTPGRQTCAHIHSLTELNKELLDGQSNIMHFDMVSIDNFNHGQQLIQNVAPEINLKSSTETSLKSEQDIDVSRTKEFFQKTIKSGLPRPSRTQSATRISNRSGIRTPSKLSKKHNSDDSWSDGCY